MRLIIYCSLASTCLTWASSPSSLRFGSTPSNLIESIEYISTKLGIVLVVLGFMHFFNMWNFSKLRRKGRANQPPRQDDMVEETILA